MQMSNNKFYFFSALVRPVAKIRPNGTVSVCIEQAVNFTCQVYGFPKPVVAWMKDGQDITDNVQYNISIHYGTGSDLSWYSDLRIEKVARSDTANYTCFLKNPAGRDMDDVSLVVLGNIACLNVYHTCIFVNKTYILHAFEHIFII